MGAKTSIWCEPLINPRNKKHGECPYDGMRGNDIGCDCYCHADVLKDDLKMLRDIQTQLATKHRWLQSHISGLGERFPIDFVSGYDFEIQEGEFVDVMITWLERYEKTSIQSSAPNLAM